MQIERKKIVEVVLNSLKKVMSELPKDQRMDFTESSDLFGGKSSLDSLMLVNFVVELEQDMESAFGTPIALADERSMSQPENPFKSVKTLIDYLELLLSEK